MEDYILPVLLKFQNKLFTKTLFLIIENHYIFLYNCPLIIFKGV